MDEARGAQFETRGGAGEEVVVETEVMRGVKSPTAVDQAGIDVRGWRPEGCFEEVGLQGHELGQGEAGHGWRRLSSATWTWT